MFSKLDFYREGTNFKRFCGEIENNDALDDDPNVKIKYNSSVSYL